MDTTKKTFVISFYDDYGELALYAKQFDTQREIEFQFVEDVIPDDRSNFYMFVRGKYPNGSLIPICPIENITSDSATFTIPKYMLQLPGIVRCDLALISGDHVDIDPKTGQITNEDEIQILSTHNFNIYVDPLPTNGGFFNPVDGHDDPVDYLTQLIIDVEAIDSEAKEYAEAASESATSAAQDAQRAEDAVEALGSLNFYIDANGHLIFDYEMGDPSGASIRFYEAIEELQNDKLDKTGGTLDGDLDVTGNVLVGGHVVVNGD